MNKTQMNCTAVIGKDGVCHECGLDLGISPPPSRPHEQDSAVAVCAQPVADTLEAVAWLRITPQQGNRFLVEDKTEAERFASMGHKVTPLHTADQVRRAAEAMREAAAQLIEEFGRKRLFNGTSHQPVKESTHNHAKAIRALSADDIINQVKK